MKDGRCPALQQRLQHRLQASLLLLPQLAWQQQQDCRQDTLDFRFRQN
jgi:hypothetical protein